MSDNNRCNHEPKLFYQLSQRDAMANLFMHIRLKGVQQALTEVATKLSDNPHAAWWLTQQKQDDKNLGPYTDSSRRDD